MADWRAFELDVCDLARHLGYSAATTPASGDSGVDVIARRGDRVVAIQCKLYGDTRVGSEAVQKLLASRVIHGATDFICISTGQFTRAALELAGQTGVIAVDGDGLKKLCSDEGFTFRCKSYLVCSHGTWGLDADAITVGRSDRSAIQIMDAEVSRKHCRLLRDGLKLYVTDDISTGGTYLNGLLLEHGTRHLVRYDDRIRLAGVDCQVLAEPDPTSVRQVRLQEPDRLDL